MHECRICHRVFKQPGHHLRQVHGITNYQKYYDTYCLTDPSEKICNICGKENSFLGILNGYSDHCSLKCSNSDDAVKQKKMNTCQKTLGCNFPGQSDIVKEKSKITSTERHGVDHHMKLESSKEKMKNIFLENFGVENPNQCQEIKDKKRKTCMDRYGGSTPMSSEVVRDKIKKTCVDRYGVDNVAKTPENREIFRKNWIRALEKKKLDGRKFYPRSGYIEDIFISKLDTVIPEELERDIVIHSYFPDGFIRELNMVIEFDEPWHKKSWSVRHDIKKNTDLLSYGYDVCRISQESYDKDNSDVINKFQLLILDVRQRPLNLRDPEVFVI